MSRTLNESPDDYCRVCKCCFKQQYGNFKKIVHISSQNQYKPSKRKQSFGIVLSNLCEKVGLPLENTECHSTKICNTCSRKILKVHELVTELKSTVNTLQEKFQDHKRQNLDRSEKRKLLTPDRGNSPFNRKSIRVYSPGISKTESKTSRRSLFSSENEDSCEKSKEDSNNIDSDDVLSKLNIDGLKTCEGRSSLKLKVVLVHPNGNVVTRNPTNEKTVQIIRNLAVGNWTAVANAVFDHPDAEFQQQLRLAVKRNVNKEFQAYSKTDSVLKATRSDELIAFSNKLVVNEAKVYCPLWHACLTGSVGVKDNDNVTSVNQLALATAIVARTRNSKMSAVAYRISSLLIHSGASYQDITRLNKLGVGMCPKSTVEMQRQMGKNFDAKVLRWKSSIEGTKNSLQFLNEVIDKQKPVLEDDSMDLESVIDMQEKTVKSYKSYHPNVYNKVIDSLRANENEHDMALPRTEDLKFTEETLLHKISVLETKSLPLYK